MKRCDIVPVHGSDYWHFRCFTHDYADILADASLALVEARRVVIPELDRVYGRNGWRFA